MQHLARKSHDPPLETIVVSTHDLGNARTDTGLICLPSMQDLKKVSGDMQSESWIYPSRPPSLRLRAQAEELLYEAPNQSFEIPIQGSPPRFFLDFHCVPGGTLGQQMRNTSRQNSLYKTPV